MKKPITLKRVSATARLRLITAASMNPIPLLPPSPLATPWNRNMAVFVSMKASRSWMSADTTSKTAAVVPTTLTRQSPQFLSIYPTRMNRAWNTASNGWAEINMRPNASAIAINTGLCVIAHAPKRRRIDTKENIIGMPSRKVTNIPWNMSESRCPCPPSSISRTTATNSCQEAVNPVIADIFLNHEKNPTSPVINLLNQSTTLPNSSDNGWRAIVITAST